MGLWSFTKNVLTLGGHSRLEDAQTEFERVRLEHEAAHALATDLKGRLDFRMDLLGKTSTIALDRMRRSLTFLSKVGGYKIRSLNPKIESTSPNVAATAVDGPLEVIPTEGRLAGAAMVGYASVSGTWTLMTMMGASASGTALSTLSGAAAYNATVAAFGGGSVAAGGLGMAGGAWVLTGIAVIPAIAFAAWSTRSKAKEIDAESARVEQATAELWKTAKTLHQIGRMTEDSRALLLCYWSKFENFDAAARRLIWPLGPISRLKWSIWSTLGLSSFSPLQQRALAELDSSIAAFCHLFERNEPIASSNI